MVQTLTNLNHRAFVLFSSSLGESVSKIMSVDPNLKTLEHVWGGAHKYYVHIIIVLDRPIK